jgi:hypothetical protein
LLLALRPGALPVLIGFAQRHLLLLRLAWKHALAVERAKWIWDLLKFCDQ